jgi:predicted glycogen debranching enzyme
MIYLEQKPLPDTKLIVHKGDILQFYLVLSEPAKGTGWLRTNLGNGVRAREEIIAHVEQNRPIFGSDWHDIPMQRTDERTFAISLPMIETGRYEAKAFFWPDGQSDPVWPAGGNVVIKVEPADYVCSNTIYSAFVRQFGPNKQKIHIAPEMVSTIAQLEKEGYTVIPRSGTFRDLIRELDFIMGKLRFRIIQLLPIFPVPTTFARMGRFGSPFAALDFKEIEPSLAEFDRRATPLDQFCELVDAIHARNGKILLDIPVNHTGWASRLQLEHPEWFVRDKEGKFLSPGAWGVTWEDLSKLDYSKKELWTYMADVFIYWCAHGVDGFRCDAGYMIPVEAWKYIVAKVRASYPDTIFFLEGLGGKIETVRACLSDANLDWAYSELFQNYDRGQIEWYMPGAMEISRSDGLLIHFAETHDNNRLASRSERYSQMRVALCAMFSENGGFGITNGVEWFAREKIDVHEATSLNWGNTSNQIEHIKRLNAIMETHPAFHADATIRMIQYGEGNFLVLLREHHSSQNKKILVLVNLDDVHECIARWKTSDFHFKGEYLYEAITGRKIKLHTRADGIMECPLCPGEVLCLTEDANFLSDIITAESKVCLEPSRVIQQRLRAKVLEVLVASRGYYDVSGINMEKGISRLIQDPVNFCGWIGKKQKAPVVTWQWDRDIHRMVMVPPEHFLCVICPVSFRAEIDNDGKVLKTDISLPMKGGQYFVLFTPVSIPARSTTLKLKLTLYRQNRAEHHEFPLLFLSEIEQATVRMSFSREEAEQNDLYVLCTNGKGAMAQIRYDWSTVRSQYDALLAANLDPEYPVDRHIMFTRCRAWLVHRGYSHPVDRTSLERISVLGPNSALWEYTIRSEEGRIFNIAVQFTMIEGENTIKIEFLRRYGTNKSTNMPDEIPAKLIIRPDIENRVNHNKTKAYLIGEASWLQSVTYDSHGFIFSPQGNHQLNIQSNNGTFVWEPEWYYMVHHPIDGERGYDDRSDLFSPGYFYWTLKGGETAVLIANVSLKPQQHPVLKNIKSSVTAPSRISELPLQKAMQSSMRQFIVSRKTRRTIIAGYPWFLDWGRDTLICLRGMISAGMLEEASDILTEFGSFEDKGTLPNTIRGKEVGNRDTSDAPLWFIVACRDLMYAQKSDAILNKNCSGRTLREIIRSVITHYINGTPNGIKMDSESGLIFSPAHFTWMDTNFPACTPREGYPIEIQALWYASLKFVSEIDDDKKLSDLAQKVKSSIMRFYPQIDSSTKNMKGRMQEGRWQNVFLSDCLHSVQGMPAAEARADDFLRPNQLFAVTLHAIEDVSLCRAIVSSCEELLVPGAMRSLASRRVTFQMPIYHNGRLLNNPECPYWGHYIGDEDTRRKPAYHNGTAWTWLLPLYCEALFLAYGEDVRRTALAILGSSVVTINKGCIGQIPEILDGDYPHTQRGCGAQAWSVMELYRVLDFLKKRR